MQFTLRCLINGEGGGEELGRRFLLNLINGGGGVKINGGGVGILKNQLISVMNEKRDKCLILMFNLKVSKQTRNETSKNKVIIKRVSNISKLSKSK